MNYRTEDEVRDSAKLILGFDKTEPKVKQGTGQITTFNQLGFKGVIDKPDGWYLSEDNGIPAIILETKSEAEDISLQKWVKELKKNCNIVLKQYKHIVGILYNGQNIRVFLDNIEAESTAPTLQDKWKLDDMKKDVIKLPIKVDGTPDFAYMESYIQKTRTIAMERISILQSL